MRGLESSHSVLQQPLAYAVVRNDPRYPPYACVRDAPDAGAQEVGRLPHGRTVYGFPSVGWLRLGADNGADLEGQWVFIGRQLAACCLQIAVRERRTDGLEVEWAGVPGARATYSVDWELGVGAAAGARGHNTLVSSPLAALAELPAGCAVRVRVLALLAAPGAEGAGAAPMRVFGPWLETATEAAAPERPGGAAAGAGGAAEAGEAGGLGEAPAAAAARPGAAARDGGAREAPGAGAPRPAPPAARGPRAEAEAGRGGAGAPEEGLEESAQPRAARGRKWSVRDLVESFEAKYAFNAKAMWECRACGRLLPREARAGCLCEAAPPGAPAPGAARPRAAGAE